MGTEQKRVLVLGVTGVNKKTAVRNLKAYREDRYGRAGFEVIHFEDALLQTAHIQMHAYLDSSEIRQRNLWIRTWRRLSEELNDHSRNAEILLLCMHGVIARKEYGSRSLVWLQGLIESFRPSMIVTLIDDVYLLWYRTQQRAGRHAYKGVPTLEQLLNARRAELFLGDLISKQSDPDDDPIPHYVLSIWHPASVLDKLIFRRDSRLSYMSFPITAPRRAWRVGDLSLKEELDDVFKQAVDREDRDPRLVFFCPLTIDEYPLIMSMDDALGIGEEAAVAQGLLQKRSGELLCVFDLEKRWNVRDFYGPQRILLTDDSDLPLQIEIPLSQIRDARGLIKGDVTTRDYRLVAQSNSLAMFNPVLLGETEMSRGAYNEMEFAMFLQTPVHIYQDPQHDPQQILRRELGKSSAAMGGQAVGMQYVTIYADLQQQLQVL